MMNAMIFAAAAAVSMSVDFDREVGRVRPELHSSGFGPQICSCPQEYIDDIKSMGFHSSRTHDWALINPNERVCDMHHIFPLADKDAKDPSNYYFDATDYLLRRTREELGHDVFFRLGTSIEHSGLEHHFNANVPKDFDKVAEIFAATIRHYNRGWANGYNWGIKYWELWNEPDGVTNMWFDRELSRDGDAGDGAKVLMRKFAVLFAKCLKRIKDEFGDSVRVGGPALMSANIEYFTALREECDRIGVRPDFVSWHGYREDPEQILQSVIKMRRFCDESGWKDCELVLNEWHYFSYSDYSWKTLRCADPEIVRKIWTGPRSHNGIDSSCFNLAVLSMFQYSKLDQGHYYGCRNTGMWGYMDEHKQKYKVYYGLRLFGDFIRSGCDVLCYRRSYDPEKEPVLTAVAAKSADGKKRMMLVADYRVRADRIEIEVKGVPDGAKVTAKVHDYTRDMEDGTPEIEFRDGVLTIAKRDLESAAYLVTFE